MVMTEVTVARTRTFSEQKRMPKNSGIVMTRDLLR